MGTAWNPSDKHAGITLSNGNLTAAYSSGVNAYRGVRATMPYSSGKYYYEYTVTVLTDGKTYIGLSPSTLSLGDQPGTAGSGAYVLDCRTGGNTSICYFNGTPVLNLPAIANGDVIMLAVDFSAGKLWFGKNGTWFNSGNPGTGANPLTATLSGTLYPHLTLVENTNTGTANFGSSAFAYSIPDGFNTRGWPFVFEDTLAEGLGIADLGMSNSWDYITDGLILAEILGEKYPIVMQDYLSTQDRARGGFIYLIETESILSATDLALMQFILALADGLNFADEMNAGHFEDILESLFLSDLIRAPNFVVIGDVLFAYDTVLQGWHKLVPDTLDLADTISSILTLLISEWITLIDSQLNNWDGQEIVPETLNLYDLAENIQQYFKIIDESLVTTDVTSYQLMITVLEYLRFTELVSAMKSFSGSVSESFTLTDEVNRGFEDAIADVLAVIDATSVIATFIKSIEESLTLSDVSSLIGRLGVSVTDPIIFVDTITSHAHLYSLIYDTLALNVIVELDGEVWECYVLNTPKFHPSMYSGFDFNSFCVFENRAFGANDTGIYELAGETDAGSQIHTGVILSETNFGSPNQKRFRRGYLDISGTSPKMILETGEGQRQAYAIDEQGKTVASHELKSKSWILSVADFETLGSMKLIPIILTK